MQFVADRMLGKLARWLRMLGYACSYPPKGIEEDQWLIDEAKAHDAVLLTRDEELATRCPNSFLLTTTDPEGQLAIVIKQFKLQTADVPAKVFCPTCGGQLRESSRAEVATLVPPNVLNLYKEFWQCSQCGQIYWPGSHWPRIKAALRRISTQAKEGE